MKILNIAFKDSKRSARSGVAFIMMFGLPLLIISLFYLAFGGIITDSGDNLTATKVQAVNLDQGQEQAVVFSLIAIFDLP